jgi:hypothetical protein
MSRAVGGVLLIVFGLAFFFLGGSLVLVRALGLGFAITGVLMLIVTLIEGGDE